VGSVILFDADEPGYGVAWQLIAGVSLASLAFFLGMVTLALRARRRAVVSGAEELIGMMGEALNDFDSADHLGRIRVRGEEWQARTRAPISRGVRVKIISRDGLVLTVTPDNLPNNLE
jgi:membrane-bound serine protease (ClpP class)